MANGMEWMEWCTVGERAQRLGEASHDVIVILAFYLPLNLSIVMDITMVMPLNGQDTHTHGNVRDSLPSNID